MIQPFKEDARKSRPVQNGGFSLSRDGHGSFNVFFRVHLTDDVHFEMVGLGMNG